MKIPVNPWSRFGVSDDRWLFIYIATQVVIIIGLVPMIIGMFFWEDKQYLHDLGTFLVTLGILPLGVGSKSENEDEYDRILRRGMIIFCALVVICLPVVYIITFIW